MSALLLAFAAIIAVVGISSLTGVERGAEQMYTQSTQPLAELGIARATANENRALLNNHLLQQPHRGCGRGRAAELREEDRRQRPDDRRRAGQGRAGAVEADGKVAFARITGALADYGDLFMAGARDFLEGGHLFRIELSSNRRSVDTGDPRLADGVADNANKWHIGESENLLFGRNFGVGTDMHTGPDGSLYVVSLTHGVVYEIHDD